jgi:hypothetical protein
LDFLLFFFINACFSLCVLDVLGGSKRTNRKGRGERREKKKFEKDLTSSIPEYFSIQMRVVFTYWFSFLF